MLGGLGKMGSFQSEVHLPERKVPWGRMLPEAAGVGCPVSCQPPEALRQQDGWLGLTALSPVRPSEKLIELFPSSGCWGLVSEEQRGRGAVLEGQAVLGTATGSCHCVCQELCHDKPTQPLLCELQTLLLIFQGLTDLQLFKRFMYCGL